MRRWGFRRGQSVGRVVVEGMRVFPFLVGRERRSRANMLGFQNVPAGCRPRDSDGRTRQQRSGRDNCFANSKNMCCQRFQASNRNTNWPPVRNTWHGTRIQ